MRCDEIQMALSEQLDGERVDADVLDGHVAGCAHCQNFLASSVQVRRHFRLSPLDEDIPEITGAVVGQLPAGRPGRGGRRPRWRASAPVAASLVVGMLVGGLVTASGREPSVAEELGDRVLAAQFSVDEFEASITIEEYGWHPDVPVRRYDGVLGYAAPEELVIELRDRTSYPDETWAPNDARRVVTRDAEWSTALPGCPRSQLPGCLGDGPRTTGVTDRVPLSGLGAQALDVVVPVQSLALGGGTDLGTRAMPDGQQVGVTADVAQLAPLLESLLGAGNWRELYASDQVELWVDATTFTPREVIVRAAGGGLRERWAQERGLGDRPDEVLLEVQFVPRETGLEDQLPSPPDGLRSAAFVDSDIDLPIPTNLPVGMRRHRSGIQVTTEHDVATVTWNDARAWLRLRGVDQWSGGRLFGDLGPLVRRVTLSDGRTLYVSGDGATVAIHTDGLDLLLEGSVRRDMLVEIAASIPVTGLRVPADWAEAADSSLTEAAKELPGVLVPSRLDGFGPPAVQVSDGQVVIGYAGSGGRELVLTQQAGNAVSPPVVLDVIGIEVRTRPGRYLPASGELEWVEEGMVVSLRSDDLGLIDLLRVAGDLQALP